MLPIIFAERFDHQSINALTITVADPLKRGEKHFLETTLTYEDI
jgi:hypothetical protein